MNTNNGDYPKILKVHKLAQKKKQAKGDTKRTWQSVILAAYFLINCAFVAGHIF